MGGVNLNNIKDYLEIIFYAVAIVSAIPLGKVIIYLVEKYQKRVKIYDVKFNDGQEISENGLFISFYAKNILSTPRDIILFVNKKSYKVYDNHQPVPYSNNIEKYFYKLGKDVVYDIIFNSSKNNKYKLQINTSGKPKKCKVLATNIINEYKKQWSQHWQKYIEEQQILNNKTEVSETSTSYI
ncbi:MAG: hypothetical protein IJ218_04185 [Alphaproteobacteria bacterium]|nr:hypothetical protein [Alphaproteobacteria bacterium]